WCARGRGRGVRGGRARLGESWGSKRGDARAVRRAGRGGGEADRRCPRHRRVPAPRPGRDGGSVPEVGLAVSVETTVNGEHRVADDVWPGESLLYMLRERLGLFGSKNACEQGECGSCSVYLDGVLVCGCLVLAGQANGRAIETVEGLDATSVQEAFVRAGAVQCGFCTQSLIVATHDLLSRVRHPVDEEIREALAGNICRCTGYARIIQAVHEAAG